MPTHGLPEYAAVAADENDGAQNRCMRSSSQQPPQPDPSARQLQQHQQQPTTAGAHKRPRRNKSAPPSTISVPAAQEDHALLLKLSEACRKHALFHTSQAASDEMPAKCSQDLKALKVILPKVEKAYSCKRTPEAQEVAHLCDFYRDVLVGGYCPFAPQIFQKENSQTNSQLQPDGHEVLSRVHYLYHHLTSPKLVVHAKLGATADSNATELLPNLKTCHRPAMTTWTIEKTIAHLLYFMANDSEEYSATIQLDLVRLLRDLAILSQIFNSNNDMLEGVTPQIQLELFPKMYCKVSKEGDDTNQDGFLLDIPNRDCIWSLQSATLNVLFRWCHLHHQKIFEPIHTAHQGGEGLDTNAHPSLWKQDLLASLRPVLFSNSASALAERSRSAALELLIHSGMILPRYDPNSNTFTEDRVELGLLLEVGLLIVKAIAHVLIRTEQWIRYSSMQQQSTQSPDVLSNLTFLLRQVVFFPPGVCGYTQAHVQMSLREAVLQPLLGECLPWIQTHEQTFSKEASQLRVMVLRAIHICLCTKVNGCTFVANPVDVVGPLLDSMKDVEISGISMWVLKALLKDLLVDVDPVCDHAWSQRRSTARQFWIAPIPAQPSDYPSCPPSNAHPSPTKPLSPQVDRKSGGRTKRKTSILGSSPLTILSPTTKRRKEEHPPSTKAERIFTSSAVSSHFVEDVLQTYLIEALQAADRISEYAGSCSSGLIEDTSVPKRDVNLVAGSVHLLLCLSQNQNSTNTMQQRNMNLTANKNMTMLHLVMCWRKWCSSIATAASRGESKWTKDWQLFAALAIDCGLHSWLASNSFSSSSLGAPICEIFQDGCTICCNALGSVAAVMDQFFEQRQYSHYHNSCKGLCKDIQEALTMSFWDDPASLMGSNSCLCGVLFSGSGTLDEESTHVASRSLRMDCTAMLILSLSFPSKSSLLACFCERFVASKKIPNSSEQSTSWATRQSNDSLYRKLLLSSPFSWNEMVFATMALSPLMLLATCPPTSLSPSNTEWKSMMKAYSNDFLKTVVLPAVQTVNAASMRELDLTDRACHCLFIIIRHFQWLHSFLEEPRSTRKDPERVFNDLNECISFLCRPVVAKLDDMALALHNPSGASVDGLRREATFRLANVVADASEYAEKRHISCGGIMASVRLLRWRCVAWEFLRLNSPETLEQLMWLVQTPISEADMAVREFSSQELGKMLLVNNGYGVFALFAETDEEWNVYLKSNADLYPLAVSDASLSMEDADIVACQRRRAALDRVMAALFNEIDSLLVLHCGDPPAKQSLLPAGKKSSAPSSGQKKEAQLRIRRKQMSAIKVLSSLCHHSDVETAFGKNIVEQALCRIVRLLTISCDDIPSQQPSDVFLENGSTPSAAFGQMVSLFRHCDIEALLRSHRMPAFTSALIRDIIFPSSGVVSMHLGPQDIDSQSPAIREQRYQQLYSIIQAILGASQGNWIVPKIHDIADFVDDLLPDILAQFVVSKDYDCLRLLAGFLLFLQGRKKQEIKARKNRQGTNLLAQMVRLETVLGDPATGTGWRASGTNISTADLEHQTKLLCVSPNIVERMIPSVFMKSDRAELTFFTSKVLQGSFTLKEIITGREQVIVKMLVWNLGMDPDLIGPAMRAIRTAAVAKSQSAKGLAIGAQSKANNKDGDETEMETAKSIDPHSLASAWLTQHFMYIIVNVIQRRYSERLQRLHAMRCLNGVLAFLLPKDAPQYFPQVMATVNSAIEEFSTCSGDVAKDRVTCLWLRLLAVQALSKFCRVVSKTNEDSLGQNLTAVVVSLIPVLSEFECSATSAQVHDLGKESARHAIDLLQWLTKGQLGKSLAKYFKEIPFLPATPNLDGVRSSLKANDVDFDNLLVMTQGTQHHASSRESHSEAGSLCSTDNRAVSGKIWDVKQHAALSKRIVTVCSLLGNENASIRKVVLRHLVDLLRANRALFYALIENEGGASTNRFLTVSYSADNFNEASSSGVVTRMMGILLARCVHESDSTTRKILGSCLGEIGAIAEHWLGNIIMSRVLGASDSLDSNDSGWHLSQPPWKSQQTRYELQLVTRHLVVALKAAPTSSDQHKIAFTIQQLLRQLDRFVQGTHPKTDGIGTEKHQNMSTWLREQLEQAGVYGTIEPFWHSEFSELESFGAKEPPFFQGSSSYYMWLSHWCRFMVKRSKLSDSPWCSLFYACRTALRTPVGLRVAEFILPLLVLDRLCFGESQDRSVIIQELCNVFAFHPNDNAAATRLNPSEHRKAVNTAFMIIETLQIWTEQETEESQRHSRSLAPSRSLSNDATAPGAWPADESTFQIHEVLAKIPLLLRAEAAASVGMYARALRLLEMAARDSMVDHIFNSTTEEQQGRSPKGKRINSRSLCQETLTGTNLIWMKDVLAKLNDCDTMVAMDEDSRLLHPVERTMDSIRKNEACGNWEAALRDYERIQQLHCIKSNDAKIQLGALRCLLELGQFESVINQVKGLSAFGLLGSKEGHASKEALTKPFAVEAAWRLGRWSTLSELLREGGVSPGTRQHLGPDGTYQMAQGEAMLAMHERRSHTVGSAVGTARQAVMDSLSSVARESYSRAYPYIVRLHCLRELEDASDFLCLAKGSNPVTFLELTESISRDGWGWQKRLELVAPSSAAAVINMRLALARLAEDSVLEGSLFLSVGKNARKKGLFNIAADLLAQAEAAFNAVPENKRIGEVDNLLGMVKMQLAKLKHDAGESTSALKMLGEDDINHLVELSADAARSLILSQEAKLFGNDTTVRPDDGTLVERFACRVLQSTQWMVEGGLKDGAEIISRFRLINKIAPTMEKGHFQLAKYIDSVMQSRASALMIHSQPQSHSGIDEDLYRADVVFRDKTCQEYTLLAMRHYNESLKLSLKHVYQALPRLLSLWFEFTAISDGTMNRDAEARRSSSNKRSSTTGFRKSTESKETSESFKKLEIIQNQSNRMMAEYRQIPPQAFYTAMPQLISQIMHKHRETAKVVQGILTRVLAKFPEQAMWPLVWLLYSKELKRAQIGKAIFTGAQNYLLQGRSAKNEKSQKDRRATLAKLLVESRKLTGFLNDLANFKVKQTSKKNRLMLEPWRGEIALCEFIPPVQAALSVAIVSSDDHGNSKDLFPREVPRMRDFSLAVDVMNSKAKPKKLTAFVIPCAHVSVACTELNPSFCRKPRPCDIGEIHFLVKQEARGDLRKDARVQDLNNVINRLMASSRKGNASSQTRQLRLRTFAVTCLSEVTGMLEWVPKTSSLRSLIHNTYNPQAAAISPRRRGHRIDYFGDATLRVAYEQKCQELYFRDGNLTKAAAKFEEYLLKQYPPLFYWWFVQQFQDPHAWYEARTLFTLSAAAWSGVGHVIGLGDRHSENILLDTTNGECVHVDFDCIFDKGLNLPKPEVVPFRLTANMLDAFGPTGADGAYTSALKICMTTLRNNRDTLLSVLEPFIKDPVIDWKRARSTQSPKKSQIGQELTQGLVPEGERQLREAKHSVKIIDERLQGIYNLRNPNHKKIKRTDGWSVDQNVELARLLPLSVEGQVHKMIAEATSSENLVQLYVGWMPWL